MSNAGLTASFPDRKFPTDPGSTSRRRREEISDVRNVPLFAKKRFRLAVRVDCGLRADTQRGRFRCRAAAGALRFAGLRLEEDARKVGGKHERFPIRPYHFPPRLPEANRSRAGGRSRDVPHRRGRSVKHRRGQTQVRPDRRATPRILAIAYGPPSPIACWRSWYRLQPEARRCRLKRKWPAHNRQEQLYAFGPHPACWIVNKVVQIAISYHNPRTPFSLLDGEEGCSAGGGQHSSTVLFTIRQAGWGLASSALLPLAA